MVTLATEQPFSNIARQMNKALDAMHKGYYNFCPSETWTPNVNLYENDTAYLVCVDLAGVDKEKIDVVVENQQLQIRGNRAVPQVMDEASETSEQKGTQRIKVHLLEIDHGAFCREVDLPRDVAQDQILASYRNGLLWIELPKK